MAEMRVAWVGVLAGCAGIELRWRAWSDQERISTGEDVWISIEFDNDSPAPVAMLVRSPSWGDQKEDLPVFGLERIRVVREDGPEAGELDLRPVPFGGAVFQEVPVRLDPGRRRIERTRLTSDWWYVQAADKPTKWKPCPGEYFLRAFFRDTGGPQGLGREERELLLRLGAPLSKPARSSSNGFRLRISD